MTFLNWKPSLCLNTDDERTKEKKENTVDENSEGRLDPDELSPSMCTLINEALKSKLRPKLSAHALGKVESVSSLSSDNDFGTPTRCGLLTIFVV